MRVIPAFLLVALASTVAWGQPVKPTTIAELEARLVKLQAQVDELGKTGAEAGALAQSVTELMSRVTVMREELDELERARGTGGDVVGRIDALDARLGELSRDVAALRSAVQAGTAPETQAPAGGGAEYRDGFLLSADGGSFTLRAKGYAQLRAIVVANEVWDERKETSFLLRRARLGWDGHVYSKALGYKVQVEFGRGRTELLDYYVEGKLGSIAIRGGQFKVPFSRNFVSSSETLSFVERAVATEEFRYDRDLGLTVSGKWLGGRVEAVAGVFNGAGRNVAANDNEDLMFVARAQVTPLGAPWKFEEGDIDDTKRPALSIGVGATFENTPVPDDYRYGNAEVDAQFTGTEFDTDVDDDGERDNVRVIQVGVDLAFRFRGLGIEAELYGRKEEWGAIGQGQTPSFVPDDEFIGAFAQATYFVVPARFQVGGRVSWTEISPIGVGGKRKSSPAFSDERREYSLVAAYYRHRHGIELSAMYSFLDWGNEDGATPLGAGEQRFILEAQVGF